MLLNMWKKYYTLRRFGEQRFVDGYAVRDYSDSKVYLDIQPQKNDTVVTPDGKRRTSGITAYGEFPITIEDVSAGTPGDWLYYEGWWYECKSSMMYEHSLVSHYTSTFVIVTEAIDDSEKSPPDSL